MPPSSTPPYTLHRRYLHAKSRRPLTLRYIGPLPPSSDPSSSFTSEQVWLGIEYDDPTLGKHSGTFQGIRLFDTREEGSGAFLKYQTGKEIVEGKSLVESLEERYGLLDPASQTNSQESEGKDEEEIILGSSNGNIVVEAKYHKARQRLNNFEKLRNIGFGTESISRRGGNEEVKAKMKDRLKGVKWLGLEANLLGSWEEVADIASCFEGLEVLTLRRNHSHSKYDPLPNSGPTNGNAFSRIKELHLSDCSLPCTEIPRLARLFPALEVLHLEANKTLRNLYYHGGKEVLLSAWKVLKEIKLGGCPLESWDTVMSFIAHFDSLESLDLSFTPVTAIPRSSARLPHITRLTLLGSSLTSWESIDALPSLFPSLTSFRFSLPNTPHESDAPAPPETPSLSVSHQTSLQRSIIIAKIPGLSIFNSTPITEGERRDAEMFYLGYVERYLETHPGEEGTWGRWDELGRLHGRVEKKDGDGVKKAGSGLKKKMITLQAYNADLSGGPSPISLLPSSPLSLLQRKAARLFQLDSKARIRVWTVRQDQGGQKEKAVHTTGGDLKEVGWWFEDGDDVIVQVAGEGELWIV
ncbi:hypothetical protein L198_01825 [Cryptococcus wingfieldii CBS 7118]|uniref:CAP-Gly domain-containing protein n=1 Tax=Cryptococcus wingfieldii CBS 7118 TaxID=1295528 RepID=A0A1E3JY52_9TREE|nr:hypothetical protein L198_01825 [Cryptococcus wingfieldii CBS 7118]ODO05137.1 hypothetical protein L198_01825 [Cryptococcus wingfieldii CBS 7118]